MKKLLPIVIPTLLITSLANAQTSFGMTTFCAKYSCTSLIHSNSIVNYRLIHGDSISLLKEYTDFSGSVLSATLKLANPNIKNLKYDNQLFIDFQYQLIDDYYAELPKTCYQNIGKTQVIKLKDGINDLEMTCKKYGGYLNISINPK